MPHQSLIEQELAEAAAFQQEQEATVAALKIDLAAARRINENQQATIQGLQEQLRRERSGRGGWGDRC